MRQGIRGAIRAKTWGNTSPQPPLAAYSRPLRLPLRKDVMLHLWHLQAEGRQGKSTSRKCHMPEKSLTPRQGIVELSPVALLRPNSDTFRGDSLDLRMTRDLIAGF